MSRLATLREHARTALARLTHRERRAVYVMAVIVFFALWAQLLWSAHHERTRLARQVGELRIQNAVMRQTAQAMADAKTQGRAVTPLPVERGLAALADELRAQGIAGLQVLPDSSGQLRLSGEADFDAWIGWLASVQEKHGIELLRATVETAGQPGMVRIEAVVRTAPPG